LAGTVKFTMAMCVTMPNFMVIGQTVAEIWQFNGS